MAHFSKEQIKEEIEYIIKAIYSNHFDGFQQWVGGDYNI
jgi:hypothetical protein